MGEEKERNGSLEDTIIQLNEEIELISTQKIKLAAECEQNMEQVRDLVMSKSMSNSDALLTMKTQIDQLSHSVRLKDEEVINNISYVNMKNISFKNSALSTYIFLLSLSYSHCSHHTDSWFES